MNFNMRIGTVILAALLVTAAAPASGQQEPQRSITPLSDNLSRAQNDIHFTVFLVTPAGIVLADPINRELASCSRS